MRSLILVGVTPLPKDIRENNRPGTVRPRVILVPISAAWFDLLVGQHGSRCGHNGLHARRTGRFRWPTPRSKAGDGPCEGASEPVPSHPGRLLYKGARRHDYRGYTEHAPLFDTR